MSAMADPETPGAIGADTGLRPDVRASASVASACPWYEPLKVTINGQEMLAEVKQFSTGSFGWYMNAKTVVSIDGKAVSVQIGMNMAIVGSKDAER